MTVQNLLVTVSFGTEWTGNLNAFLRHPALGDKKLNKALLINLKMRLNLIFKYFHRILTNFKATRLSS